MGYRTSIRNINSVAHLIGGNVYTFLQQSISSDEMLKTNMVFLDELLERTSEQFYMSEKYWSHIERDLMHLRHEWRELRHEWRELRHEWCKLKDELYKFEIFDDELKQNKRLLDFLYHISNMFSRCRVKSILLPGVDRDNPINSLLSRKSILRNIVKIHPGDTALILQVEEGFSEQDKAILNVFPHFDKALYQMNDWPGVFLWSKDDSIFLPVAREQELYEIFEIVRYEHDSFNYLRERFEQKNRRKKYAYLLHMSDLHFGNKLAQSRSNRVVRILENQMNKLEEEAKIIPVITGDLMDSPNDSNKNSYLLFSERLCDKGFYEPIHILGNHDVDIKGIFKFFNRQKSIISSLSSKSKIELYEELKLAIVKFDSNIGGVLAQGKIGEDQLMEIGNEIDAIKNKDSYTFIALLHHHPIEIKKPRWYENEWYEKILGVNCHEQTMKLIDADLFLAWIKERGIKYILHGHKHIPQIKEHDGITIIAAGSSTGCVRHQDKGKTYLSYNLIKYDMDLNCPVSVSIVAEEIAGAGTKNILNHLISSGS